MFLMLSYWMSEIFLLMFVSISKLGASILFLDFLLTLMFLIRYSKYLERVAMVLSCSIMFD